MPTHKFPASYRKKARQRFEDVHGAYEDPCRTEFRVQDFGVRRKRVGCLQEARRLILIMWVFRGFNHRVDKGFPESPIPLNYGI